MEGILFPSELEASTYEWIRLVIPAHRVICHHPIRLLGASEYFRHRDWKVDFTIMSPCETKKIFIEAKGIRLLEFVHDLQLIAFLYPSVMDNLIIVHHSAPIIFSEKCVSVSRDKVARILRKLELSAWLEVGVIEST